MNSFNDQLQSLIPDKEEIKNHTILSDKIVNAEKKVQYEKELIEKMSNISNNIRQASALGRFSIVIEYDKNYFYDLKSCFEKAGYVIKLLSKRKFILSWKK